MNTKNKKWVIVAVACSLAVGAVMAATTQFVDDVVITTAKDNVPVLSGTGVGGVVFTGTWNTGSIPISGGGTRMMWFPKKAAFRAGRVTDTQWDIDSVGHHSTAFGYNSTASGSCSLAVGDSVTASGSRAVALGEGTTATAEGAVGIGYQVVSSGTYSLAFGYTSTSSGVYSTALGSSTATGNYSIAASRSTVSGHYAAALGRSENSSYCGLSIGRYNVLQGNPNSWVETDPIFVIGIGTGTSNRKNAFVVKKNGNVETSGNITVTGTLPEGAEADPLLSLGTVTGTSSRIDAFVVRKNGDVEIKGNVTLGRQGDVLMGEFGDE